MKLLTDRVCWCPFLTLPKLAPLVQHLLLFLAFLFLLLGFCQDNNNNKKLASSSHCKKLHPICLKVPLIFSVPARTNFVSSFWTRKGKTEGKAAKKKEAVEALEKMEKRGCMSSSEPFLSEQLTLFGMQSIVSGTCFENKKTAGSSWRNRVMAQRRAGRKLCTHYPHTDPSLASFLFHC